MGIRAMITADDFREIALDMQDAFEGAHMGHPDFRANGRIFATLHTGDKTGMVSLTPEEQQEFMKLKPAMFTPCAGAWGRQGATNVILKEADKKTLRAAMNLAWQRVTAMPPPRKRAPKVKKAVSVKKR
jgi:YjbR